MITIASARRPGAHTAGDASAPPATFDLGAARVSSATAAAFLALLALLHVVKPEYAPSWRFVSEYAIGRHGWLMIVAFIALGVSCATAAVALRPHARTRGGKIGLVLLLVVAASLVMAGVFVMDPITTAKENLTRHGNLHGLAAMIGIPTHPIAALLVSRSIARSNVSADTRVLRWTAHATWASLLFMYASIAVMLPANDGKFGPEVLIGWPNRLVVVAYCAWQLAAARQARQLSGRERKVVRVA